MGHTLTLRALGLCSPSLISVLIIAHFSVVVKHFFEDFFYFFLACAARTRTTEPTDKPQTKGSEEDEAEEDLNLSGVVPWSVPARPCGFIPVVS